MSDSEWREGDGYYWSGPGGWTICRVFVDPMWRYELWSPAGVRIDMWASFDLAVAAYEQRAKG